MSMAFAHTASCWQSCQTAVVSTTARSGRNLTLLAPSRSPLEYGTKKFGSSHSTCPKPRRSIAGTAASAKDSDSMSVLREALQGNYTPPTDSSYQLGAEYLKSLGIDNKGELMRILDVAMNPNSLFGRYRDKKRAVNASARRLSVDVDMKPVVAALEGLGLSREEICEVIAEHPPILSYSSTERLQPFVEFLSGLGMTDLATVIRRRPTILGLDLEQCRRIVGYLQENDYTLEQIEEFLSSSL